MGLIKSLGEHTEEVVNRSKGNLSSTISMPKASCSKCVMVSKAFHLTL